MLVALALIPWFIVQINMSINPDLAYLTAAAGHLLDGMRMSDAYYDTNPPLSVIVQIPPALLVKLLHIPVYDAVFIFALIAVALSSWAVYALLQKSDWSSPEQNQAILATYILINTIGANLYLGEKDHLLGLALFPFVLVQIAITHKIEINKTLKWTVIGAASVLILLKPHFGLIPLVMFGYRAVTQKRLTVFLDADFIALASTALAYIALIFTCFPDFIDEILPDALILYTSRQESWVLSIAGLFILACIGLILIAWLLPQKPQKAAIAFFILAGIAIIPFALQGKGLFYHSIPAILFITAGLSLLITQMSADALAKTSLKQHAASLANITTTIAAIILLYTALPPNPLYMTHKDYRNSDLAKIINTCTKPDCSFFMFNDMIEITQQLAVYTGQPHASRFPVFWFLPSLVQAEYDHQQGGQGRISPKKTQELIKKYAALVTQDFQTYQPDTLIIRNPKTAGGIWESFDFMEFFSNQSPDFTKIAQNYEKTETITIDRSDYFKGTIFTSKPTRYDIYKKKRQTNEN